MIGRVSAITHIVRRLCLVLLVDTPRVSGAELFEHETSFLVTRSVECSVGGKLPRQRTFRKQTDLAHYDHQVASTKSTRSPPALHRFRLVHSIIRSCISAAILNKRLRLGRVYSLVITSTIGYQQIAPTPTFLAYTDRPQRALPQVHCVARTRSSFLCARCMRC
jgi:hypothetical protein